MKVNRISPPTWARQPTVTNENVSSEGLARLRGSREALLAAVHAEVLAYLSDPSLTFAFSDDFPNTQDITGDYYIGDEHYGLDSDGSGYHIYVMAHCLAHPRPWETEPGNYLGLAVWLETGFDCREFATFRNTDSSVQ